MAAPEPAPITSRGHYERQRFVGIMLSGQTIEHAEFEGCVFERGAFLETTWRHCRFTDCRFINCDLSMIKVPNTSFMKTQFRTSKLIGIDWTVAGGSAFAQRIMTLSFDKCVLNYATFVGMDLPKLVMTACTAHHVSFADATLAHGDFHETDFTESIFLHTDLTGANFIDALNYAINPLDNRVREARFTLPEALVMLRSLGVVLE